MSRTRKRAAYIALETGGYAVDPDSDGSSYLPFYADPLGDIQPGRMALETAYADNTDWPTASEPGAAGGELTFSIPLLGMASLAGDGASAGDNTDDVLDLILRHVLGTQSTTSGEGCDTGTGSTNAMVLDTDALAVDDLTLVYDSAIAAAGGQARSIFSETSPGTYVVQPDWDTDPTANGVAYGMKIYTPNSPFTGGDTLAMVYVDSDIATYTCLGGRITALAITANVNERVMLEGSIRFDSVTADAGKTGLPTALSAPPYLPVQMRGSPVYFGGVKYGVSSVRIDLGLNAAPVHATEATNGRADDEMITMAPVATITPLRTDALRSLGEALTTGDFLVQFGRGTPAAGRNQLRRGPI